MLLCCVLYRASAILAGLAFTTEMQSKATKYVLPLCDIVS